MTTTNTIIYTSNKILKAAQRNLDDREAGARIIDWHQTSDGFPFDILIEFDGGAKEMNPAIELVQRDIDEAEE